MFDNIKKPKFPITIKVGEYTADIYDEMQYDELNLLADHLYTVLGYKSRERFDYYCSSHPMERNMFAMACVAKWFNDEVGL